MSSALRLSIIMVLLLATTALGLIAYNMNLPKPVRRQVAQKAPAPVTTGILSRHIRCRQGHWRATKISRCAPRRSESVPSGAILDTPDAKAGLRGSLVRKFLDTGSPVTAEDVLRPRDRGFLASVLAPGTPCHQHQG